MMMLCVRTALTVALAVSLAAGPAWAGGYTFTTVDGPAPNDGGTHLVGITSHSGGPSR